MERVTWGTIPAHDSELQGPKDTAFFGGHRVAARRLALLDSAETLGDLATLPAIRVEVLQGDRAGQHSVRINDQWRGCSRWADEGPSDLEIADCH